MKTATLKDDRRAAIRARILVATSIVCGSGAAALIWHNGHRTSPLGVSDGQARAAGFASADRFEELLRADRKMLEHGRTLAGWDEADFSYFEKALADPNRKAAITVIMNLGSLHVPDQRRRALGILGQRPVPKDDREAWAFTFRKWSQEKGDASIVPFLLGSGNPDVASIMREVNADEKRRQDSR